LQAAKLPASNSVKVIFDIIEAGVFICLN
jgi:hypothetical protein